MQPNFHDGFVDGLLMSKPEARIFLRTEHEEKFTLILHGVETLVVKDFRQGNIILSIDLLETEQLKPDFIYGAYEYDDIDIKKFASSELVTKAREKSLRGVEISPSYGCTLLAIFKRYEFANGYAM
jgi:hypothetical protein